MFGLCLVLMLAIPAALLLVFGKTDDSHFGGLFLCALAGLALFFGTFLPTAIIYTQDHSFIARVAQYQTNEQIYKAKAKNVTAQLEAYLAVEYPNLEQKVFKQIASNPKALFTIYPQLRSSTTLIALAGTIESLQNQVYAQETNVTRMQANVVSSKHNLFVITWFMPSKAY